MKVIAVFAAVLAVSSAQIIYNGGVVGYPGVVGNLGYASGLAYSSPLAYSAAPVAQIAQVVAPVATKTQYHSQNELGEAAFGHSEPTQTHAAVRDASGGVRGVFSYVGKEGIPFTTHYVADQGGYRVASNALPVAPSVAVVDTPEVHAAKIQHAAAHSEALIRAGRRKRGVVSTYGAVAAPISSFGYGYSTLAASPVYSHAIAAPAAVTYSAPAVTYAASPVVHSTVGVAHLGASHVVAAPTYAASHVIPATRVATLTKVVNTPGHAVSYRVD